MCHRQHEICSIFFRTPHKQIFLISIKAVNGIWNKQFFMREIEINASISRWWEPPFLKRDIIKISKHKNWQFRIFSSLSLFSLICQKNAKVKICSNLSLNICVFSSCKFASRVYLRILNKIVLFLYNSHVWIKLTMIFNWFWQNL